MDPYNKIIFLDFDGVINSELYFLTQKFKDDYTSGELCSEAKLDPENIKLINKLVSDTGATVVASTAWRIHNSVDNLNYFLKLRGAKFELVDSTPIHKMVPNSLVYPTRGLEIQDYLDHILIVPESIVIIDDNADMAHLSSSLVQTNPVVGFTVNNLKQAKKILNMPYENKPLETSGYDLI